MVAIAGNIGVGKSSLTALLARRFGWRTLEEPARDNPYLADFYADMTRWGFHSQLFFLTHRVRDLSASLRLPGAVLQDRTVYEDAEVFARNLYNTGYLSERDWRLYCELYETLLPLLPPPNLVVYLRASVERLLANIARRNRDYERTIDPDYIRRLNVLYDRWADSFSAAPVLTIATDDLDFVHRPSDLDLIADRIGDAVLVR